MAFFDELREKVESVMGERCSTSVVPKRIFHYYKSLETREYAIYEPCRGGDRIVAAYGDMILVQNCRNKNSLTLYPYYKNKHIFRKIKLDSKTFPGLLSGSTILKCAFFPYMRVVGKNQYLKSVRLVIITDKAQIYHNFPARDKEIDGFSKEGDIVRFEESVVWDLPGRKYPVKEETDELTERYYPNLPAECYQYHPQLNTDINYRDKYHNGGFGKKTVVMNCGKEVEVSRFYIHNRVAQSNPFYFIGTGETEYKMSVIATYRSNVDTGVRTCVFATTDGGRQWYCKYEFADMGEYKFRQGNVEAFGKNFGNGIVNSHYDGEYNGDLVIKKRNLVLPSKDNKEPNEKFVWTEMGKVHKVLKNKILTIQTETPHMLTDGNIVVLSGTREDASGMYWMLNSDVDSDSAGNGLAFKVEVIDEYSFRMYELVSSPDNNIPCRHIHHVNRIKDGWIFGTGEIYPNGWEFYLQMKAADSFTPVRAYDEFPIIRLNSSEDSVQRTMGMLLLDEEIPRLIYASDHDLLERDTKKICSGRSDIFMRNSTGVFECSLETIDNRKNHRVLFEATEPCFYFQELSHFLIFCGQRGEMGISFDRGKTWLRERIKEPIINYQGCNGQRYYFDSCILVRK